MDELPTSFGNFSGDSGISSDVLQERYDSCLRDDYKEHVNLKKLMVKDDGSSSSSDDDDDDDDKEDDSDEDDEDDEDEYDEYESFPITHEFKIQTNSKKITSIELNKSGSKFLVGSQDSSLKIYDYNNLSIHNWVPRKFNPFNEKTESISEFGGSIKESGNYTVKKIKNDKITDNFLVIPNHSIFKILDSYGNEIFKSNKGDVYLHDLRLTKGHISEINDGIIKGNMVITCSSDATVRVWDINQTSGNKQVSFFNEFKKSKTSIDNISYCGLNDKNLVLSDSTGQLSLFDSNNLNRPLTSMKISDSGIISLLANEFNKDQIFTRSFNDELKIFDIRFFKDAVSTKEGFSHRNQYQNLQVSDNGSYLIGCTYDNADEKGDIDHQIHVLDINDDLKTVYKLNLNFEPTCLKWDYNINEILIGSTSGDLLTLFSKKLSKNGVKLLLEKKNTGLKRSLNDDEDNDENNYLNINQKNLIYNSEDLYNKTKNKKQKKFNNANNNNVRSKKKINIWGKSEENSEILNEDPREELLKYAQVKNKQT
ncbi:hypothetical protein PACTADRAFT_50466 [Pachysolen tannophilus NRRL Y-2460]|uniref:Uncharacterized protein n=1 Tax=Pachysolen tannophilus NRRL Y-2460 TaxID=669874 RepID=A0A1E4TS72_PACTA|nr:hypothetical protein PACTADRAFT_50466 [Pachysolen tannophilus NRRL Y-2460]